MNSKKTGILLVNLGTPDAPDPNSVGKYLREFLGDEDVIDINPILRWILVNLIIVPFRKAKSSHAYQQIWSKMGSPLLINTNSLASKLSETLNSNYKVAVAMRYGSPDIKCGMLALNDCEQIKIMPLYPQKTKSSYDTAVKRIHKKAKEIDFSKRIEIIEPFYDKDFYIESIAEKIQKEHENKQFDHFLFSYHGIPVSHHKCCQDGMKDCKLETCYRTQCHKTSELIAKKMGIDKSQYTTGFQSRLGRQEWIKPYTDHLLKELPERGIKNLAVISPSFIVDCLETLEEIDMGYREDFIGDSDRKFTYIPCLNDDNHFVKNLSTIF